MTNDKRKYFSSFLNVPRSLSPETRVKVPFSCGPARYGYHILHHTYPMNSSQIQAYVVYVCECFKAVGVFDKYLHAERSDCRYYKYALQFGNSDQYKQAF